MFRPKKPSRPTQPTIYKPEVQPIPEPPKSPRKKPKFYQI